MNEAAKTVKMIKAAIALVCIAWVSLGCLPVFSLMFGYTYLPSIDWMDTSKHSQLASGLIMSVASFVLLIKANETDEGKLIKIGAILFAPFLGYFVGSTSIAVGVPMVASMVAGHTIELPYEVVRADGNSQKGCRTPIELEGLPFMFDSLCGISNDVRRNVTPRMRIIVGGRGTTMGIHPTSFQGAGYGS